ncbi:hypothetical protein GYN07_02420 [Rhizobium leguminosarum bv. viciae 248]|uniref:hypothetical protein n=1 Tax=Rhizobium leguminosarum TaxID=384 RepID=UPI0003A8AE8B|nr:hypothetical protein [Rhizobium leguminosarum]NKM64350.1 hypothetical protein [Rhizobium leguminosarum bv. viciae]QHW23257.1 hypothetical protein GYN07_02420 [Rhizobium leguminosarum bv. viciae 248]
MSLSLKQLLFNHNATDKQGSALNLRIDYDEAIVGPEWARAPNRPPFEQSIAYAARSIDPAMLGLFANFAFSGPPPQRLEIQAVPDRPRLSGADKRAAKFQALALTWAPINPSLAEYYSALALQLLEPVPLLGRIAPTPVAIAASGESGPVFLKLNGGVLKAAAVGIHEIAWRWQFRTGQNPHWQDFETSYHRIFTTLDLPVAPWIQEPAEVWNSALPWSQALELACDWSAGAMFQREVAASICGSIHAMGGRQIEYGCPVGAREMYANTPMGIFDLTAFIERSRNGLGNGPYVNCTDCACAVSTLANLLGVELWQGRMGEYDPAFLLRASQTIGHSSWGSPCGLGVGFMFHEVAWSGGCREEDQIYDASVVVDSNLTSYVHFPLPLLPAGIQFGAAWQPLYRQMLAAPGSLFICHPLPEERRRRALI